MEPNILTISKKIWNIVKAAIFMIKKGLNKKKIFMDLNMMMKRGKIAGKALKNIMFHNHHHLHNIHNLFTSRRGSAVGPLNNDPNEGPQEYEFSCSNTPSYIHYLPNKSKKHQKKTHYYMPSPLPLEESSNNNISIDEDFNNMLEMMLLNEEVSGGSGEICAASPLLPGLGFGQSPAVRQLRITDSPFPVQNMDEDKQVDQAAEDFINKFYSQLKKQIY